jgi:hypothetical protein
MIIIYRNAFMTEYTNDDIPMDLANNFLLNVDLSQLTIRNHANDRTFQQLLGMLNILDRL